MGKMFRDQHRHLAILLNIYKMNTGGSDSVHNVGQAESSAALMCHLAETCAPPSHLKQGKQRVIRLLIVYPVQTARQNGSMAAVDAMSRRRYALFYCYERACIFRGFFTQWLL